MLTFERVGAGEGATLHRPAGRVVSLGRTKCAEEIEGRRCVSRCPSFLGLAVGGSGPSCDGVEHDGQEEHDAGDHKAEGGVQVQ